MIHVHPDLSSEQRTKIEDIIGAQQGVVSAHFSPDQLHELTVAYDPTTVNSETILKQVRQWDKDAVMVGL